MLRKSRYKRLNIYFLVEKQLSLYIHRYFVIYKLCCCFIFSFFALLLGVKVLNSENKNEKKIQRRNTLRDHLLITTRFLLHIYLLSAFFVNEQQLCMHRYQYFGSS